MTQPRTPDPRAALYLVPRALLGSSLAILAVAALVHLNGRPSGSGELEVISWMAVAWAAVAPVVAAAVRRKPFAAPAPPPGDELTLRLQKTIVFFGVLESAVVFAAAALVVSPLPWPLAAACIPLAAMLLSLPPRAA